MSKKPDLVPFKDFGGPAHWRLHERELPSSEAVMMAALMERWALVAAVPDGEDGAGRQKMRMPTAAELAERCADIVAAFRAEVERRGWIVDVPTAAEAEVEIAKIKERERHNDR